MKPLTNWQLEGIRAAIGHALHRAQTAGPAMAHFDANPADYGGSLYNTPRVCIAAEELAALVEMATANERKEETTGRGLGEPKLRLTVMAVRT
jgi:hypothetical protein